MRTVRRRRGCRAQKRRVGLHSVKKMNIKKQVDQLEGTVEELKRLITVTERPKVKDILVIESRKVETKIYTIRQEYTAMVAGSSGSRVKRPPGRCYDVRLSNYGWDQSEKFVKIYITLKNLEKLDAKNIECVFGPRSLNLKLKALDGKNYILNMIYLLEEITVENCYWKKKGDTMLVFMAKKSPGVNWSHLTIVEKKASEPKTSKVPQCDDPNESLMEMMRQMYCNGDEDTKKTIEKAWADTLPTSSAATGLLVMVRKLYQDGDADVKNTIEKSWLQTREKFFGKQ